MALENDEPLMEPVLVDGYLILCIGNPTRILVVAKPSRQTHPFSDIQFTRLCSFDSVFTCQLWQSFQHYELIVDPCELN